MAEPGETSGDPAVTGAGAPPLNESKQPSAPAAEAVLPKNEEKSRTPAKPAQQPRRRENLPRWFRSASLVTVRTVMAALMAALCVAQLRIIQTLTWLDERDRPYWMIGHAVIGLQLTWWHWLDLARTLRFRVTLALLIIEHLLLETMRWDGMLLCVAYILVVRGWADRQRSVTSERTHFRLHLEHSARDIRHASRRAFDQICGDVRPNTFEFWTGTGAALNKHIAAFSANDVDPRTDSAFMVLHGPLPADAVDELETVLGILGKRCRRLTVIFDGVTHTESQRITKMPLVAGVTMFVVTVGDHNVTRRTDFLPYFAKAWRAGRGAIELGFPEWLFQELAQRMLEEPRSEWCRSLVMMSCPAPLSVRL